MLCCGAYRRHGNEVVYIKDHKKEMVILDTQFGEECVSAEAIMNSGFISISPYNIVDMMRAEIRELRDDDSNSERIGKLRFLDRVLGRFNLSTGDISMGEMARQITSIRLA